MSALNRQSDRARALDINRITATATLTIDLKHTQVTPGAVNAVITLPPAIDGVWGETLVVTRVPAGAGTVQILSQVADEGVIIDQTLLGSGSTRAGEYLAVKNCGVRWLPTSVDLGAA